MDAQKGILTIFLKFWLNSWIFRNFQMAGHEFSIDGPDLSSMRKYFFFFMSHSCKNFTKIRS